jgi:peptide/nickel transport system permease protein
MSVVDIFLAFPSLLLAIGLVSIVGTGHDPRHRGDCAGGRAALHPAAALAGSEPAFARLHRRGAHGEGLAMVADVAAHRPNTIAPLLVAASIAAANAILVEASLSFLGLGIMPPAPSLGNIIRDGQPTSSRRGGFRPCPAS